MKTFHIQLLDTDTANLCVAGQKLRRRLAILGIDARVEEISCFLEISRRGYMRKLPAIFLDGQCMCSRYPLADELLEDFCQLLKKYIGVKEPS